MCTSPSTPGSISTNAPNVTKRLTVPVISSPFFTRSSTLSQGPAGNWMHLHLFHIALYLLDLALIQLLSCLKKYVFHAHLHLILLHVPHHQLIALLQVYLYDD